MFNRVGSFMCVGLVMNINPGESLVLDRWYLNCVIDRPDLVCFRVMLRYAGEKDVCVEYENGNLDTMGVLEFINAYHLEEK
jgi:hypothetical protein